MARKTLSPDPLYGWDPALRVETEKTGPRHTVYLNGSPVGFLQSNGGSWDYFTLAQLEAYQAGTGSSAGSPRLAYGAASMHDAACNLLEHLAN